jgi:hypothetical protein
MGCCGLDKVGVEDEELQELIEEGNNDPPPALTMARVSLSEEERVNSVNVPPPEVFYVIVGCGPAAVINHTTLRASAEGRKRIGKLRVMHIGFKNPWPSYLKHGMGQPPYLLSLPGFVKQPNAGGQEIDGGLNSRVFGGAVDNQLEYLLETHEGATIVQQGWVAWVQAASKPESLPLEDDYGKEMDGPRLYKAIAHYVKHINKSNRWPNEAPYRLIVFNPVGDKGFKMLTIYAAFIDLCTGPGRPTVDGKAKALAEARTPPWLAPETWSPELQQRKILNGVDAIVDEVEWAPSERICVTAGGGVGLNAAEKARNNKCFLDWFGRNSLIGTFGNPRNHTFLRHHDPKEKNRPLGRGELDIIAPVGPKRNAYDPLPLLPSLRFGKGAVLDGVTNEKHLTVTLKPFVNPKGEVAKAEIIDFNDENALLHEQGYWECAKGYLKYAREMNKAAKDWPSPDYDRLVIPNGQQPNALGHPVKLTEIGTLQAYEVKGRMTGLASADGFVRLLGAACQVHPQYNFGTWNREGSAPRDLMWTYHSTLPVSAVLDGFILSASNIATANGYFEDYPNCNVNTMTLAEVEEALPKIKGVTSKALADAIVGNRQRVNGYPDYEALMATVNDALTLSEADEPAITAFNKMDLDEVKMALWPIKGEGCAKLLASEIVSNRPPDKGYPDYETLMKTVNAAMNPPALTEDDGLAITKALRFDYPKSDQ